MQSYKINAQCSYFIYDTLQLDSDAPENPGAGIIPGAHGFWGEPANALNVLCRLKLAAPCGYPRRFPPYCS